MAVDTQLFFDFSINFETTKEVIKTLRYLFSEHRIESLEDDERLVFDCKLDPKDSLYEEKQIAFIKNNCFKPLISNKFFDTNTEPYRYNWRAIAGWLCQDSFRRKYFLGDKLFYLGKNRLYNNQLNDFLDWIVPYIDCFEQKETCIGWVKYEDYNLPKLIVIKNKNKFEILK